MLADQGDPSRAGRRRSGRSVWLWDCPADAATLVRFALDRALDEVFVNGADPRAAVQCAALRASGIGAACLGGDPRWVFEPSVAIEWARATLRRTGCRTLHLDVEPWTLPEWAADPRRVALAYVDLVERCGRALPGVAIEIDMAPWLFTVVPVEAGRVLRATASITVLAYRDRADSILEFAGPAERAATASRRPFRLGVETMRAGPGVPPETTFADDGAAVLNRELAVVDAELADNPHYRGVAVHHWAAWRDLRP